MGQLEKYGLYILCVVVCLIMSVAIMGDAPANAAMTGGGTGTGLQSQAQPQPQPQPQQPGPDRGVLGDEHSLTISPVMRLDDLQPELGSGAGGARQDAQRQAQGSQDGERAALSPERGKYTIADGDTYDGIARRLYGPEPLFRDELMKLNPALKPTALRAGKELVLPSSSEIALWREKLSRRGNRDKTGTAPVERPEGGRIDTRAYRVISGDSLAKIARTQLGSEARVGEIRSLNPGIRNDLVRRGDTILLPVR